MPQVSKIKPLHKYLLYLFYMLLLLTSISLVKWQLNNSMEIWFYNDDPELVSHRKSLDEMGEWEWLAVVLETKTSIYDRNFLIELQNLSNDIAKLNNVKKVISIANARETVDDENGLGYRVIFDSDQFARGTSNEKLKQSLLSNPIYIDTLIKKDNENTTVLMIQDANDFDDGGPVRVDLVNGIKAIMSNAQHVADYSIVGTTALNATLNAYSLHDIYLFNPLVFAICIFFGWWVFGNWRDLAVALSLVSAVVTTTISFVVYSGIELNMATVMLPAILISLSMASVVHVITHFHQLCEERPGASLYAIAADVVRDLWIPCWGSAFTTIVGLLTLLFSGTTPIIQLGAFAAAGIFLGFVLNMTVVPLLLIYFWNGKAYQYNTASRSLNAYADRGLEKFAPRIVKTSWPIILIFALGSAIGMSGLKFLESDSSYLMLLNEESETRAAYKHAEDSKFATSSIRVLLEMENGLEDPATFLALDELQQAISKLTRVIKVVSPVDGFKEIDRAVAKSDRWTEKDYLHYERETFAQLLFVSELSNNDDMKDLLLLGNKTGQIFIFTPYLANSEFRKLADEIDTLIAKHLPVEIKASVTGIPVLWANMDRYLISTQIYGVLVLSFMIVVTLLFSTRSMGLSAIGLVVNLLPVMTIIGIMSWMDIKLDIGTVVIGGIALGLAVDDTIYFLWHYVNQRRGGVDVRQALIITIQSTGIAIILTSLLIAASFSVMTLSHFSPTSNFGLFTSAAILLAMAADLFLLPAILILVYGKQKDAASTA